MFAAVVVLVCILAHQKSVVVVQAFSPTRLLHHHHHQHQHGGGGDRGIPHLVIRMGQPHQPSHQQQQQQQQQQPSTASSSSWMVLAASPTSSSSSSVEEQEQEPDEVAALFAAAAKARQDADRLTRELGRNTAITTTATPNASSVSSSTAATFSEPKKSLDQVQALLPALLAETNVHEQVQSWQALKASQSIVQFGHANLNSFPVSLSMLEQRTGLTPQNLGLDDRVVDLDEFKYATLYVVGGSTVAGIASLALLPENIGATLCYLFAIIPILFIGIGSTSPGIIADAIAAIKGEGKENGKDGNNSVKKVSLQERICRHEAAHFCCGYWCGLPVTSTYSVSSTKDAKDGGVARVEFGCVPEPGSRGLSKSQVAGMAVTALAGTVGEALQWKDSTIGGGGGGAQVGSAKQDLLQLETVVFRQSAEFIGAVQQQDLTRWGALTAALLLQKNRDAYEKVVQAFARQASVEECIVLLES